MLKKFLLAAVMVLGISMVASAWSGYVNVTNRTGYTINYLYVSHQSSSDWEEDVLGSSVIANGATYKVTLSNYPSPVFDIKCVDADGDSYTFRNINCQTQDVTVTLADMD